MCKRHALLVVSLLLLPTLQASADIAAINASALPQETAVLGALDDSRQLEPYSHSFSANWQYPASKEDVATRLGKDLGFLRLALKSHPDNAELLLLTGLVARYAYNLDVEGSHDAAVDALEKAQKMLPADFRAPWFRATLMCQTMQLETGAEGFLTVEASRPWDQLPVAFWDDYLECAAVTDMPAHLLRAAENLEKLHAPESKMRAEVTDATRKRFEAYKPNRTYKPEEVWQGVRSGEDTVITSTMCGVRLHAHGDWGVNQLALNNGSCVAYFSSGPYKAVVDTLHPSVLVLVQQPKGNETLQEFSKRFLTKGTFEPYAPSHCPAPSCVAMKGLQPEMYKVNGDGHGRVVFFERDEPEFPGLVFESPVGPPSPDKPGGAKYYRPNQIQKRIPGRLYYLVLLDTAASIEEPAMKDFDFFLQNLTVE